MLKQIKKQIDVSLKKFLKKIRREYRFSLVDPILYKSIEDFILREGKRIRPLLLILAYKGYSKTSAKSLQSLYDVACSIELLHDFMLIHDDIIDRSDLRRNKPTMHRLLEKTTQTKNREKLGFDLSIIAGDIVYAMAIDAFTSIKEKPNRKEQALKYFIKTTAFTAMGEFTDILYGFKKISQVNEKDIFLNYTLKTAHYTFECPLVIGAILAGASQKEIKRLSKFGINLGLAFQIQDDILGIFGTQKKIGKSILSDLAESKKTLLTSYAYRYTTASQRKVFLRHFNKKKKSYKDLVAIRRILIQSGSLRLCLLRVKNLLSRSQKTMRQLKMNDTSRRLIWDSLVLLFNKSDTIAHAHGINIKIR